MHRSFLAIAFLSLSVTPIRAADPSIDNEYFEKKVRPILVANCIGCHGPEKQKGELRLDSRAAMLKGGETGPAVKPGDVEKSLLTRAIRFDDIELKMPKKRKMTEDEIATLTAWVKGGAPWPEGGIAAQAGPADKFDLHARAKAHWSFQPIRSPVAPAIHNPQSTIHNPIDAFLLAKLEPAGLGFAPPAEKRVLIRRVTFDLIGLPPTPEEMSAFLADTSPQAYEKVVDRLLASPHYGERWGRHWLDLVRYAETHGHEFDFEIADAWRYRDYVVRAFNADVPYNQFLTEHIAGDLVGKSRRNPKGGANESLLATGFWWLGEAKHSPVDSRGDFADRVDNQIDVFGKSVLGLTLACARCHDHKFDPIATKDYYALFGVLASSRFQRADVSDPDLSFKLLDEIAELKKASGGRKPPVQLQQGADAPRSPMEAWREKSVAFESFNEGWRQRWDASGLALRPEAGVGFPNSGREARKLAGALRSPTFVIDKSYLLVRMAGRDAKARLVLNGLQLIQAPIYGGLAQSVNHGEELRWIGFDLRMWKGQPAYLELLDDGPGYFAVSEAWFADSHPPSDPSPKVALWEPGLDDDKKTIERIRELEAKLPDLHRAPAMRDGTGRSEKIFIRGNHKTPGVEAPRAFLEAFGQPAFASPGSGRLELAKAVTDPNNPLVARVMVNRIWKHHFGEGIVRSPDDFGYQGQRPTHPELLDWLAVEFVNPPSEPPPPSLPGKGARNPSPGPSPKKGGEKEYPPHSLPGKGAGGLGSSWSIKHMHRLMLLSTAYRQSSRATPEQAAKAVTADAQNKLLHRQNVRRVEAEAIRDSMLLVSGRLDRTMEGAGILPYLTEHSVGRGRPASGPLDGNGRRSIYLQVRRNFLNPMFVAFDYPTPFTTIGRRTVSNVPAQALTMLNNPFVLQQADLWAKRSLSSPGTAEDRVRGMYVAAFGRESTKDEVATAVDFVQDASKEFGKPDHPKAWADLAHVLLNSKEFIFVE